MYHSSLSQSLTGVEVITCFETLEHLIRPSMVFAELFRVLCPSGLLLLSILNQKYEQLDIDGKNIDQFHLHIFSKEYIINLLERTGFQIIDILGQDICNRVLSRMSEVDKADILFKQFQVYDESTLRIMSYIFGYPDSKLVDESYSCIFVCKKEVI